MKLNVLALGLACGILWAVCCICLGIMAMFNWGNSLVDVLGSMYIGYKPGILGAVIGGIWAFFDAGIGGVVIAWLYNRFAK